MGWSRKTPRQDGGQASTPPLAAPAEAAGEGWDKGGLGGVLARLSFVFCLLFVSLVFWALLAKPAWADPHGVYYTVTGQQQLFFNVLAALNQADYVELSGNEITTINRSTLADSRGRAGAEAYPPLVETETGLSDLISRLITLEGFDLYTDVLVRQLAAEKTRLASGEEMAEVACERVFGKPGCKETTDTRAEKQKQLEAEAKAYIKDPLDWEAWPLLYGAVPALFSGNATIEELRGKIAAGAVAASNPLGLPPGPGGPISSVQQVPFAYSPDLHFLRQRLSDSTNLAEVALRDQIEYLANEIAVEMFGGIQWHPDYAPNLSQLSGSVGSNVTVSDVIRQGFLNWELPMNMRKIAEAAANRVAAQQELIQVDGSKTNVRVVAARDKPSDPFFTDLLRPQGGNIAPNEEDEDESTSSGQGQAAAGHPGELTLELLTPSATKREELAHAVGYGHVADVSQRYGSPEELLREGDGDLTEAGGVAPAVLGATSGGPSLRQGFGGQGTVAGDQDDENTNDPALLYINTKPAHAQGMYGRMLALILNTPEQREAASLPKCGFSGCPPSSP